MVAGLVILFILVSIPIGIWVRQSTSSTRPPSPDGRAAEQPLPAQVETDSPASTAELPPEKPPPLPPRYEIVSLHGQGGLCVVYRAHDRDLDRFVAVKTLRKYFLANADIRRRFLEEARAMALLSHPGIVKVFDLIKSEPPSFVMELIGGRSLRDWADRVARLPPRKVATIGIALASAIDHAHSRGVIHRDIKPENVLVSRSGRVMLTDFGLAKLLDRVPRTAPGMILGSFGYMSPEQTKGGEVGPPTDIYSIGVLLYELATGEFPGDHTSAHKPVYRPALLARERPEIPAALARVIDRAMCSDIAGRQRSAAELRSELILAKRSAARATQPDDDPRAFETLSSLADVHARLVHRIKGKLAIVERLGDEPEKLLARVNSPGFLADLDELGTALCVSVDGLRLATGALGSGIAQLQAIRPLLEEINQAAAGGGFEGIEEIRQAHALFRNLSSEVAEVLIDHSIDLKELLTRTARETGPGVEFQTRPGISYEALAMTPTAVAADLEVIMEALITNALEAGAKQVSISVDRLTDSIEISVADDGPGLPARNASALFAAGFTTKDGGSGSGLQTARRLTNSYGGTLMHRTDGDLRGACFVLELPVPLAVRSRPGYQ